MVRATATRAERTGARQIRQQPVQAIGKASGEAMTMRQALEQVRTRNGHNGNGRTQKALTAVSRTRKKVGHRDKPTNGVKIIRMIRATREERGEEGTIGAGARAAGTPQKIIDTSRAPAADLNGAT